MNKNKMNNGNEMVVGMVVEVRVGAVTHTILVEKSLGCIASGYSIDDQRIRWNTVDGRAWRLVEVRA